MSNVMHKKKFIVVSLGLGVNSTAMLVGMAERDIKPDLIIFSDTGAERPSTYDFIKPLNMWLYSVGFPDITVVRVSGELLVENHIRRKQLPAVAYGGKKTCSLRWKIEPFEKYLNSHAEAKLFIKGGGLITKYIGIDANESHRAKQPLGDQAKKYINEFPLIDWAWGRDRCIHAIIGAGLRNPGKSSCYCCPNMRKSEIMELKQNNPKLLKLALEMESNAELTTIAGLGRTWKWSQLIATDDMFGFHDRADDSCMTCYDGD